MSESEEKIQPVDESEVTAQVQDTAEATQTQEEAAPLSELDALKLKVASLTEELEAQKDKSMRLVAEFDNFRRRTAREQIEYSDLAQAKAFGELFPVVDNFERAFAGSEAERGTAVRFWGFRAPFGAW